MIRGKPRRLAAGGLAVDHYAVFRHDIGDANAAPLIGTISTPEVKDTVLRMDIAGDACSVGSIHCGPRAALILHKCAVTEHWNRPMINMISSSVWGRRNAAELAGGKR